MFSKTTICAIRCAMDSLAKMTTDGGCSWTSGQTEKPHHYTYLKEFRTQQCPDFLQHKCTRHRPYTCFNWHFVNQKRRRPVKRRDGTFNYSADVYCPKYDETTGICPDGDDCSLLHRVAGDAERRYHLRYFKTCSCVHETDSRGQCVKNGSHCAFAHGPDDLRLAVFDISQETTHDEENEAAGGSSSITELSLSLEKDILCNEDPVWNDMHYVLLHYKTEICRRPHRLCRQGYACPSYHNLRDKRRSPQTHKYRSTPCPSVKHGDEWGDPSQCDSGDECTYCHTRTEQQFHPEIYKSTKCNDMVQTGYCPRGPFCAFAHVEQEMNAQWDIPLSVETSFAAFVRNALPRQASDATGGSGATSGSGKMDLVADTKHSTGNGRNQASKSELPEQNSVDVFKDNTMPVSTTWIDPFAQARTNSMSSESSLVGHQKAPGCERENAQNWMRRRASSTMESGNLDMFTSDAAPMSRHFVPPLLHSFSVGSPGSSVGLGLGSAPSTPLSSALSPRSLALYSSEDTVESVIGNALDEDLGRLNLSSLDNELGRENDVDSHSICSPLSASFSGTPSTVGYFDTTSIPVPIPDAGRTVHYPGAGSLVSTGFSQSPVGLSLTPGILGTMGPATELATGLLASANPSLSTSPLVTSGMSVGGSAMFGPRDVQRLREELLASNLRLARWKDSITQARNACEAWRKEAEEWSRKAKKAEEERQMAMRQRDEAVAMVAVLKQELDAVRGSSLLCGLQRTSELEFLPVARLQQIHKQLRRDLETLEKVMGSASSSTGQCSVCSERRNSLRMMECQHGSICTSCATTTAQCPVCWASVTSPSILASS